MGKITRAELDVSLRTELDDIKGYIDATDALLLGQHVANRSNPHSVTKAQVGLGSISNNLQSDFETHKNSRNPHNTRASDVGAVNNTRLVIAGTGLSGGGALSADRTVSLDRSYTDGRYVRKGASSRINSGESVNPLVFERTGDNASIASIHRGYGGVGLALGTSSPEVHISPDGNVGIGSYSKSRSHKLVVGGSVKADSVVFGTKSNSSVGMMYRRTSDDQFRVRHASGMARVYTSKNIKYGTRSPSGGSSGDIYVQY